MIEGRRAVEPERKREGERDGWLMESVRGGYNKLDFQVLERISPWSRIQYISTMAEQTQGTVMTTARTFDKRDMKAFINLIASLFHYEEIFRL